MARTRSEEIQGLVAQLAASGMTEASLKAGDNIREFELPSVEGRLLSSEELLGRRPLVLSFFRGGWCPYCAPELGALHEALPDIEARGAEARSAASPTRFFCCCNRLFEERSHQPPGLGQLREIAFPLDKRAA